MHVDLRKHPRTVEKDSQNYRLFQLLGNSQYRNIEIVYTYDFSNDWHHFLTVKGRAPVTENFVCLSGTGHYVAEDVGSIHAWEELKEAYLAPQPNKKQLKKREWFENQASNADPQGLAGDRVNFFDVEQTTRDLANMLDKFERMGEESARQQETLNRCLRIRGPGLGDDHWPSNPSEGSLSKR
ncbi:hypothetical protein B0H67DRAFT_496144 [Lasiosphaeris hirsuta]|uniref:Plasmid pRiA4b Orf3-like domain-containing protein n=1 Tax=Lasiosphaeris hirsuta TaxID=260670 RepID=A0AA40A3A7_9PEZI|nr:hypothetical protein B0H67DRAFT_496144 [Lasiosphaeris hirsuta]